MVDREIITAIGLAAGGLTTISFLPQLVRVVKQKSARDLSYGYLLLFLSGVVMWLLYGIFLRELPVILWNAVTLVLVGAIIGLKWKYGRDSQKGTKEN